ncbi:hypothetical protein [Thiothrix lacustris]|uniref:hypothetical protein n=1 Tax=Thiothrix lacustris TaxID=525917 RepID=UPI0027E414B4|nr:hypothetical protein [Thiothrix lacustris]WMP17612.1 hypothetical protein RCS87_00755 [Thiothrix lacustris]
MLKARLCCARISQVSRVIQGLCPFEQVVKVAFPVARIDQAVFRTAFRQFGYPFIPFDPTTAFFDTGVRLVGGFAQAP